jgi:hypothetical protein
MELTVIYWVFDTLNRAHTSVYFVSEEFVRGGWGAWEIHIDTVEVNILLLLYKQAIEW